jgi:hypothetical protein
MSWARAATRSRASRKARRRSAARHSIRAIRISVTAAPVSAA